MKHTFFLLSLTLSVIFLGSNPATLFAASDPVPPSIKNARAIAEIFYNSNNGYANVCNDPSIAKLLKKEKYNCRSSKESYAIFKKGVSKKVPCVDMTGFSGIANKKPAISKRGFTCGMEPVWMLSIEEKLNIPLAKRHAWSEDLVHKYYQQVLYEFRGESLSWQYDVNKGSYVGVCKNKDLGKAYMAMMKADGLKNIECGDSKNQVYLKAIMPNGWTFCLNQNKLRNNDSKEALEDCSDITKTKFTTIVKVG